MGGLTIQAISTRFPMGGRGRIATESQPPVMVVVFLCPMLYSGSQAAMRHVGIQSNQNCQSTKPKPTAVIVTPKVTPSTTVFAVITVSWSAVNRYRPKEDTCTSLRSWRRIHDTRASGRHHLKAIPSPSRQRAGPDIWRPIETIKEVQNRRSPLRQRTRERSSQASPHIEDAGEHASDEAQNGDKYQAKNHVSGIPDLMSRYWVRNTPRAKSRSTSHSLKSLLRRPSTTS